MKKKVLLILCFVITLGVNAQDFGSSLQMSVNSISASDSLRINNYIQKQRKSRSLLATAGLAVLGNLVNDASSIVVTELMKLTNLRSNQREEWEEMIENECYFLDSLTYINSLTDFYSEGSFDGPLDPANFNFNGFNINSVCNGNPELMFFSHVATDEAGLNQIFNHSKFNLVLDSMFFNPYLCHLPNMAANDIYPDEEKDYGRNLNFSFEDRDNLIVSMIFNISSSWYNEAVMLARDVNLGSFYVQIPIDEESLIDSIFVYRRSDIDQNRAYYEENKEFFDPESPDYDPDLEMPDTTYLAISGDCFIVPRSYMPLSGGVAHWGTGEYNVEMYLIEQCNINSEMRENWHRDYRKMKRMKKESRVGSYLVSLCRQNGNSIIRTVLETVSDSAIQELNLYY